LAVEGAVWTVVIVGVLPLAELVIEQVNIVGDAVSVFLGGDALTIGRWATS
jgi:hypothetical protein